MSKFNRLISSLNLLDRGPYIPFVNRLMNMASDIKAADSKDIYWEIKVSFRERADFFFVLVVLKQCRWFREGPSARSHLLFPLRLNTLTKMAREETWYEVCHLNYYWRG